MARIVSKSLGRPFLLRLLLPGALALALGGHLRAAPQPENLARRATAWASSEHNERYRAAFAIDGKIPAPGSTAADRSAAWCVLKSKSGDHAEFTLTWDEAVRVAEVVYWGRTAWSSNDCWKDFELRVDDAHEPLLRGTLQAVDGPQRMTLPQPMTVRQIKLRFLDSHGGANPGASEIQVFAVRPTAAELAALGRAQTIAPPKAEPARVPLPAVSAAHLGQLIDDLQQQYGGDYRQAAEHRARLAAAPTAAELERLQRDALLFDVGQLLVIQRHEITASHVYTYHYEGFRAGGGLYVLDVRNPAAAPRCLVESPTGQILDADLSYDGRTVLFSWRRTVDEGYHVWSIGVDGAGLRQLTAGPWHDYNPCWLPDGGVAVLSTRWPQFAYCWHAPVGVLCRMNADGSDLRRLSANYLNDFTPQVLHDGRILYTRWEYVDRPAIPIQSLWTINPDGTGLAGYFGNRKISPGTFMEARPIPGSTRIICTMTGHNGPTRGAIGVIDRTRGVNAQAAIENLTPDVPIPKIDEGNGNTAGSKLYSSPYPLDGRRFLCSARGPVLVRTFDGRCQSIALAQPAEGMQYFAAQPVRPRPKPPVVPSHLDAEAGPDAIVYLQDINRGLEPYVERGAVQAIRVVREMPKGVRIDPKYRAFGFQFPVISCGATYAAKQVLGEVPVEADGSAIFRVPAGIPLYFMALDGEGRAVQRMRTFTHFMPGETQGCLGCHESRLQGTRPLVSHAYQRQPRTLQPPEWGTAGFDYSRIVQPVLDRYCVECHRGAQPQGNIDLVGAKTDFFNVSYETLARDHWGPTGSPWVKWIPTYNGQEQNIFQITPKFWGSPASKLADLILAGHPDPEGQPRVALDRTSRRRVFAWIDLNVPYYGTSETAYPENPGSRQIVPAELESVLADVARRRCAECHAEGRLPRRVYTRITEPELNTFLTAPLARGAGGSQRCGRAVFADTSDADYQTLLATFKPVQEMLARRPRMDMPGAKPAPEVCRSCQ